MTQINDFNKFLEAFDNGDDVLQYAADEPHVVGQDWFANKVAEKSIAITVVELPTPAYKIAYEKAAASNLTVSQFLSKLLTGKVAVL
ncbi:hypothetical protein FACS189440_10110 [Bacteroidia bacterium]|nr:hypothetical protein FACS189440_10110 [Bacteroidia bacterium]